MLGTKPIFILHARANSELASSERARQRLPKHLYECPLTCSMNAASSAYVRFVAMWAACTAVAQGCVRRKPRQLTSAAASKHPGTAPPSARSARARASRGKERGARACGVTVPASWRRRSRSRRARVYRLAAVQHRATHGDTHARREARPDLLRALPHPSNCPAERALVRRVFWEHACSSTATVSLRSMLRVTSAARLLRRAQSCASPLLHDAAGALGARPAAEVLSVERLAVESAPLWSLTAQRRLSAGATPPAALVCACVLERLPIVMPAQPAWETEYQACTLRHALFPSAARSVLADAARRCAQDWRYEKLRHTFKEYPKASIARPRSPLPTALHRCMLRP